MIFKFISWLRKNRMKKDIQAGLDDIKAGRVYSYKSLEDWQLETKAWETAHPIQHWFKENIYYPIYRIPGKIEDFILEIKYFIQRGKRGYADCDVWGFDGYLAKMIVEVTKEIQEIKHGIPMKLFKPSDKGYKDGNFDDETIEIVNKRYSLILDEIIWTFEMYQQGQEGNFLIPQSDRYYTKTELKKLQGYCDKMNEKYEGYSIMSPVDFKKYKNGWKLFTNYFSCLND